MVTAYNSITSGSVAWSTQTLTGATASTDPWVIRVPSVTWTASSTTSASVTFGTSMTANMLVWPVWNEAELRRAAALPLATWQAWGGALELTQADRAARAERLAATELRLRAQHTERAAANARAEILLKEALSAAQRAELELANAFHLETVQPDGSRRRYRIRRGRAGNVDQVDATGRVLKRLCIHPDMQVPDADTMLAQKLLLEADEATFLRVANHS